MNNIKGNGGLGNLEIVFSYGTVVTESKGDFDTVTRTVCVSLSSCRDGHLLVFEG